jgi:uncharacterized membrane protein YbhN (UPF0104 family)
LRKLSLALKVGISVAILLFLFRHANLAQSLGRLSQLRYSFLFLSIILIVAGQVVRARRLAVMVLGGEVRGSLWQVLRIQMVSFLPGVVSPAKVGEVAKVYMLQSELGVPVARGLACFVGERVLDLLLLGPLAAIGIFVFFRAGLRVRLGSGLGLMVALAALALFAALVLAILWARRRGVSLYTLWRTASPGRIFEAGILTLVYWGIVFLEVWCFCKASAIDTQPWSISLVVPPALLSSMIPISFSGFGVREAAMIVLLQKPPVLASYNQALLVSVMYDIIGLGIPVLMGILFWLAARNDDASPT